MHAANKAESNPSLRPTIVVRAITDAVCEDGIPLEPNKLRTSH